MMNPLVESLGPVFVAGFALQQLVELVSPVLDTLFKQRSWAMKLLTFVLSLGITLILPLRALRPFGLIEAGWLDTFLTALLVSSGTTWLDDLLKIIRIKKLELEARAAQASFDNT